MTIAFILQLIAEVLSMVTRNAWVVAEVHSQPAVCEITVRGGMEFANNCFN